MWIYRSRSAQETGKKDRRDKPLATTTSTSLFSLCCRSTTLLTHRSSGSHTTYRVAGPPGSARCKPRTMRLFNMCPPILPTPMKPIVWARVDARRRREECMAVVVVVVVVVMMVLFDVRWEEDEGG